MLAVTWLPMMTLQHCIHIPGTLRHLGRRVPSSCACITIRAELCPFYFSSNFIKPSLNVGGLVDQPLLCSFFLPLGWDSLLCDLSFSLRLSLMFSSHVDEKYFIGVELWETAYDLLTCQPPREGSGHWKLLFPRTWRLRPTDNIWHICFGHPVTPPHTWSRFQSSILAAPMNPIL